MTIPVTTRTGKGSPLSTSEMDTNLTNLARNATETQQGNIEIATQAEVDNGTDDTLAVTPLKLATTTIISDAIDAIPTGSLTSDGHATFPGGLILQWGEQAVTDPGNANSNVLRETVNFPITFPNAVFQVIGGGRGSASAIGENQSNTITVVVESGTLTTSSVDILLTEFSLSGQIQSFYWFAIGF